MIMNNLKDFFDSRVTKYNQPAFIQDDPVCIPHLFTKKQDIEIAGFFAAIFAWGNRTGIIRKSRELMERMDMSPYEFCKASHPSSLKQLHGFKHRTFKEDDLFYFVDFFNRHYAENDTLETAFTKGMSDGDATIENGLIGFRRYFFDAEHLKRTEKHISTPLQKSSCKRLNMFLRWMVRRDDAGVDFGIWHFIKPAQLICPLDLHVARVAKRFGLITRELADWQAAIELTEHLRKMDSLDPVKYDFALFGLGVIEKY
jgi:uncharacterized protein (TIGR02757 family)